MKINYRSYLIVFFILQFISSQLLANDLTDAYVRPQDVKGNTKGNEYISGDYPGAVLMKINLWGAVSHPGIHYIPVKTDLVTLLSFAGGPRFDAELDSVLIKRRSQGKTFKIDVNVEDLLKGSTMTSPTLEPNDIIVIPATVPAINSNTVLVVGFVASLLSLVVVTLALAGKK